MTGHVYWRKLDYGIYMCLFVPHSASFGDFIYTVTVYLHTPEPFDVVQILYARRVAKSIRYHFSTKPPSQVPKRMRNLVEIEFAAFLLECV